MPEIPFRQPVPDYRTIVDGIWSDILDKWLASFESANGVETEVRSKITNASELSGDIAAGITSVTLSTDVGNGAELANQISPVVAFEISKTMIAQEVLLRRLLEEIRLLNLRFEEAFDTRITGIDNYD